VHWRSIEYDCSDLTVLFFLNCFQVVNGRTRHLASFSENKFLEIDHKFAESWTFVFFRCFYVYLVHGKRTVSHVFLQSLRTKNAVILENKACPNAFLNLSHRQKSTSPTPGFNTPEKKGSTTSTVLMFMYSKLLSEKHTLATLYTNSRISIKFEDSKLECKPLVDDGGIVYSDGCVLCTVTVLDLGFHEAPLAVS
jgi:hypothetical protein